MQRRTFLKTATAAALASTTAGRLFAAPAGGAKLLVVFLRGGYDAANLLVPVSSDFYYEARPNIAVARPGSGAGAALPIDSDWGLHPALEASVHPLLMKKQAAFIPFAGTDDLSRSHFETQDSIEMGQASSGQRDFQSGFLNRLVNALGGDAQGMSFTDQLPLVFRGPARVPNMALKNLSRPAVDARQADLIQAMYRGTPLEATVREGFTMRGDVMRDMASEMEMANRNAITTQGFEQEARRVARLLRDRYDVGFLDVGGWDTHVGEGGGTGYLATRLGEFGRGLAALADEMGPRWNDTVVVVVSEFGRTFRENGNRGTDHGHGSVYWVLGGGIAGGKVAGTQQRLTRATLFQDRDYPVLNDYREVLGGLVGRMYGMKTDQLKTVFPSMAMPKDLALV